MGLTFVARNTTLTQAIKDYAAKRLAKLDRRFRQPVPVQLEIRKEGARREDERFIAEVTIKLRGGLIRSEERGPTPYAAIDVVEETIDRRIARYKAQFDRRRRHGSRFHEGVLDQLSQAPAQEAPAPDVTAFKDGQLVRTKRHPVAPMTVEEAAAQMDLLGHNFYVFLNKDGNGINVVYRRQDDDYGLIVPEVQ
jgi:putative sigma-54 modulation protein